MLKFTAALVAVAVAASVISANQKVIIERCEDATCSKGCHPAVEFISNQCHNLPGFINHGEMLRCQAAPPKPCFRETLYDLRHEPGCTGGPGVWSAPQEGDVCLPDHVVFSGKFYKYAHVGTPANVTLHRACDFGCHNCEVIIPMPNPFGKCNRFKHHALLHNFALELSTPTACHSDVQFDAFFSPKCDGLPDIQHSAFTSECYNFFGVGHRYKCQ